MSILEKINNPSDIKKLSLEEQIKLATEIRNLIINTSKTISLHLSSNLGIVELTISLLKNFNLNEDIILYDTGHQTYVHKILTGRKERFSTIRQEGGLKGFTCMEESEYDHYSPGHSGNILSIASGMYQASNNSRKIVAVIGDASLSNGLSFEALNDISFKKEKILIIVNDNKMSISKSVGALSNHLSKINHKFSPCSKNFFQNLDFNYIGPIDGNNLKKVNKVINQAKKKVNYGPTILHLRTVKGLGLNEAQNDNLGDFHSYSNSKNEKSFGIEATNVVLELMKKDQDIFVINPAMTRSSNCELISSNFPNRYFDVGIAEEHALSKSSGMCLSGLKPIVYIYSSFLQRAFDQLIHDISRLKLPITLLIDRADLSPGDGPTHHGIYDVGFLKTISNILICSPRTVNQLKQLIMLSQKNVSDIFAIRYPKWYFNNQIDDDNFNIIEGKWEWFEKNNTDTIIVSYGPYINKIYNEIYLKDNVNLVNAIFITKYNEAEIEKIFNNYKNIIIYERVKSNNGLVADFYRFKATNNKKNNIIEMNYFYQNPDNGSLEGIDKRCSMTIEDIRKKYKK